MQTITKSLINAGRADVALDADQNKKLTDALDNLGLDASDPNGVTLKDIDSNDFMSICMIFGHTQDDQKIGDIVTASQADGSMLRICSGNLQLLPQG